jgi:hypothetical protein
MPLEWEIHILAEQTVVHITGLFLKAALAVLGVRITALTPARKVLVSSAVAEWSYRSVPRQFWRTILISKELLRGGML